MHVDPCLHEDFGLGLPPDFGVFPSVSTPHDRSIKGANSVLGAVGTVDYWSLRRGIA